MKLVGIVLVVLGIIGLTYGGISWTKREKVLDIGSVQVTRDKSEFLPLPPIAGGLCLVAGVILIARHQRS